jgi:TonB-linked SusC/RagA family outer membrane protein
MLGTSAQSNIASFISGSIQKFASDLTQELGNGSYDPRVNGNTTDWSLMSYMGRMNYSYADKYLVTATVRRDGSSRFGKKNKWGIFPSASLAWRISEEKFLKNNPIINDLKLRLGYGVTGNQEIGLYSFATNLNTIVYNLNNVLVNAVVPFAMPNPEVKWESQSQTDIGIDAVLLNQKMSVSIDAYSKKTNDMLVPMSVPLFTGYSDQNPPFVNAGAIRNRGVELSISSDNLKGKLKWTTDFNISFNKNKVLALNDSVPLIGGRVNYNSWVTRIAYGQPVNVFYGFVTDGIFQTQQEVDDYAKQMPGNDPYNRTSPGDIRFKDLNKDKVIDDKDRTYIGDPNPKFIFALNNTFRYKEFDLNIFLQGISGNDIYNANRVWSEGMDITLNQTTATLNRWSGEGTSNNMPRAVLNDPNKNARASDRFLEDGSYLRLKNASFGYNFSSNICQKAKLRTARIYLSGTNLLTLTRYKGFDPEVSSNGIDDNTYPVTRTISIGLNLGF